MSKVEFLQGQLERLFELDDLMALSSELLGLAPSELGGTQAKGTFARALVHHCEQHDGLTLLAEAIRISADDVTELAVDDDLALGSEIKGFRVLRLLERGRLSTSYLAERPAPANGHTERAHLQVFRKQVTRDRLAVWRLLRAARALAPVRDVGLAGIYDAGTLADGRVFVASEAVQGITLAARLERSGPLHASEVRSLARSLLRGLAALHERGHVHGYLSAEHVLLVRPEGGSERAQSYGVLTDLVTARLLERSDEELPDVLRVVGDPSTIAPEVARGAPHSPASEVYAVGCLLYRALTGAPPFEARTPMDQLLAHVYEEAPPPSERVPHAALPANLDEVIARALSKDPHERYPGARELAEALDGLGRLSMVPGAGFDHGALARAIEHLREDPSDDARAAALEALASPAGAWTEAADAFLELAGQLDDLTQFEAKKRLLFRSARVLADELADRHEAARSYRAVLELDPSDAQAHDALEELHRRSGDHEALIGLLLDRLESETSPAPRAAILREVAALYEDELAQPDNALVAWTQALSEEGSDERARRAVERIASAPEQLEDVIEALKESLAEGSDRPTHAVALAVTLASWYAERLERPDLALAQLTEALRIAPAHEPALEALTQLYRKAEAWDELLQLLFTRADASTGAAQARAFKAEAAAIAHQRLGDLEQATRLYREVLADDPTHPAAVAALEEIYADAGNFTDLVALLETKVKELHGGARAQALCELAELYEGDPEQQERALTLLKEALDADPKSAAALKALERVYAARGEHLALRDILERQRELATTPHQRVALLERIGALYDGELTDSARAAEAYEQILELTPTHEGANVALARLYRTLHRFDDLAQTFDRHAKGVEDPERKVALLMQAARVLMADIGSPERAAFVCERVLALDPKQTEALALTARIRALAGDNLAALDALEVLADTEQNAQQKADLLVSAGQMLEASDNLDGAIERYKLALEAQPDHESALAALARLYERRGDVRGEAELALRRVELVSEPRERAKRLVALGKLRLDKLKDKSLAADAYERAHELDADNREALLGLGQLALGDERWADATKWLEPLLEHTTELPNELAKKLLLGAGDAFRAQDQLAKAERAYLSAKALAPEDRSASERLAELALTNGRYEEAVTLLEAVLDGESGLASAERAELLMKLGRAQRELTHLDAAAATFSTANVLLPDAVAPLDALVDVYERAGRTEALGRVLGRKLELVSDESERFALLVQLGDLHVQLDDRNQAAAAYVSALELNAEDRNLLSKLMAVYSESKDWSRLVDVLVRMARLVEQPELRAKYLHTAAGITQSELREDDAAIGFFEQALGYDPSLDGAFRGLTESLTRVGAWDKLANTYRSRIERLHESLDGEALAALWDKLGAIYLERLHRIDPAVEAYEAASALDPDNRGRYELLVELYGKQPSRFADRAILAHEQLLEHNPYRVESYRALRKLYTQLARPDEAWTVCQALRTLNMAEPEEEAFFKRHRVQAPATARECITEELWQEYLLLPEQDPTLTSMFALIQPAAVQALSQPPEAFGIRGDEALDCENEDAVIAQMFHYAAGVALLPLPPVFYRPRDTGGVSFLFTNPPALALGQGALRDAPDQALAFLAGRQLSYFRPGHYLRQLLPTGGALRGWLLAAVRLANPRFPVPEPLREQVEHNREALARTLHVPQQQALTSLVGQLLRDQPELDLKRWALALDLAADRVGFVLANSLDAAVAMVRASPRESSFASERDRLKALYAYAVSPRYLALRNALGITIA